MLPAEWNLQGHGGNARKGFLIIADLRSTRLELRWRTPALGRDTVTIFRSTLRRFPAAKSLSSCAAQLDCSTVLATDDRRLYELTFPDERCRPDIFTPFLENLRRSASQKKWRWCVYGANGDVPAYSTMTECFLLPGEIRLAFRSKTATYELGSHSLADRLLNNTPIEQFARTRLASQSAQCSHYSDGRLEFTWQVRTRLGRRRHFRLHITHAADANAIVWQRISSPSPLAE
jgi:hypothetical protein